MSKKFKVLLTSQPIPEIALDLLRPSCELIHCAEEKLDEIRSKIVGVDAVLWITTIKFDAALLDAAGPQLKIISVRKSGIDSIDVAAIKKRGILLTRVPLLMRDAVADVAIGLMIAAGRRFDEGRRQIEKNKWETDRYKLGWMTGQDITGSTVGIVGLGGMGQTIAKRLQGFDIKKLLYCGPTVKAEAERYRAVYVPFAELLKESDFVIVASSLNENTANMFDSKAFKMMKPNCVFVNIARGGIVDQDALIHALENDVIFAAGLDCMTPEPLPPDHRLVKLKNCVLLPHVGWNTKNSERDTSIQAVQNILDGLNGAPLQYAV